MALYEVVVVLPTARTDGSPLAAADIGSVALFEVLGSAAATQVATLDPSTAVGGKLTFDLDLAPGALGSFYAQATDKQSPPLTSDQGEPFPFNIPAPLAKPNPPVILSVNPKS